MVGIIWHGLRRGLGDDVGRGFGGTEVGCAWQAGSWRVRSRTHGVDSDKVSHGLTTKVNGF